MYNFLILNFMTTTGVSANSAKGTNVALTGKSTEKKNPAKTVVLLPNEKSEEKAKTEVTKPQEVKPQEKPQEQPRQQARPLTIDEINDKAERLHTLQMKYQTIKDKRKQLDSFTISHDRNNAQLTLVDAEGLEINTSNPQSIGKLLKDWMCDLNTSLSHVEEEMRKELNSLSH